MPALLPLNICPDSENNQGQCVIDNLHARYGQLLGIERDHIKTELEGIDRNFQLLAGTELVNVNGDWVPRTGWTTHHIARWCENYVLYDAAIMGGSSWSADKVHEWTNMIPSSVSSAVVCGAIFAGAQKGLRNDSNYGINFGAAALNEFVLDWAGSMGPAVEASDFNADEE